MIRRHNKNDHSLPYLALVCLAIAGSLSTGAAHAATMSDDPNLKCAALISVVDGWAARGVIDKNEGLSKSDALVGSMTYLNMYAIPKGITERDAFRHVKAVRVQLSKSVAPQRALENAKQCLADLG